MTRYRIDPEAQRDLDEIYDYVANDSVAAADGLIDTFKDKFGLLASEIGDRPRFRDNAEFSRVRALPWRLETSNSSPSSLTVE